VLEVMATLPASLVVNCSLVWVPVLEKDNLHAAQQAVAQLKTNQIADPRLHHFYDPQQRAAREMASALGGKGSFAWDTYLVFSPGVTWTETAPQPSDWVHQLDHSTWAPAQRRYKGQALIDAIWRMIDSAQFV